MRTQPTQNSVVPSAGERARNYALLPLTVLVAGLFVTALAVYQLASVANQRDQATFERHVQRAQASIFRRMDTYTALLHGTAGLMTSDDDETTAAEYRAYVDKLLLREKYPGLLGIGFSLNVPPGGEQAVIEEMRRQGTADFRIWPESDQPLRTTITYLEPLDARNQAAIGFDMFTEEVRREAMQRAQDEGVPIASGRVTLVQEIDKVKQPGFLIYLPVYDNPSAATDEQRRGELLGFAYSPIRAWDFFRSVEADTNQTSVSLAVYDGNHIDPQDLLFRSELSASQPDEARFGDVRTIEIAGHPWTMAIYSTPSFNASVQRNFIPLLGGVGALLTLLLTGLVWRDARSRSETSRAREYAEATLRTSPVPLLVLDSSLRVITANEAFYTRFQVNSGDTHEKLIYELGNGQWDIPRLRELLEKILPQYTAFNGYEIQQEFEHIGLRTMILNARRMEVERGGPERIVLVIEDITERKRAEDELQRERDLLTESELRYRLVGDASHDAIWDWDLVTNEVTWNEGVRTRFGYTTQQIGSDASWWVEQIHPDDRERIINSIHAVIDGDRGHWHDEYRYRRADGSYAHVFDRGRVVRTDAGEPLRMVGSMLDLTERIQAEEKLRVQEAQYRSIFESTSDAILIFDCDGRLIEVNPAACAMHGYTYEELIGMHGTQLVQPDDHHKFDDFVGQVTAGKTFRVEGTHVRKDGQLIAIRVAGTSFVFGGRPALLAIIRDVTEEKRAAEALHESEQRLRFIMDSMPQKIFTATPGGEIDYLNPIWMEFTGLSFETIREWGWTQFVHPDDVDENVRAWRHAVETGESFQFEHRFRRADGQFRWHISRALPMSNDAGQIIKWIGSNTEIHDVKCLQEELRRLAADLAEANRRKTEFLATLGHELRNPLAPIRTGLELLKMVTDPAQIEDTRSIMERQTQQLVRLIDDLLDVSRITQGKLQLRRARLELAEVVQSAVEAARPFIDEAGHELTVRLPQQPIYLEADPNRLAQVFSNLLNNSTKYTPEGGRIWLSAERQDSQVVVTVKDTGIGIPADMQSNIFEMFNQIDRPLEQGYKGLGIGLTLVKRLVEMHDGTVEVRSDGEDQGSEFSVKLPILIDSASPAMPAPNGDLAAGTTRLRILVVDDNRPAADMLAIVVKMLGNEVRTAYDGSQGVEMAAEFNPDVVLMDIGMPKMNGHEAASYIRTQQWGKDMLLVALTGWGQEEDRQRTKEAGFDHHLVKPAEPAALRDLFAGVIARK